MITHKDTQLRATRERKLIYQADLYYSNTDLDGAEQQT